MKQRHFSVKLIAKMQHDNTLDPATALLDKSNSVSDGHVSSAARPITEILFDVKMSTRSDEESLAHAAAAAADAGSNPPLPSSFAHDAAAVAAALGGSRRSAPASTSACSVVKAHSVITSVCSAHDDESLSLRRK